LKIKKNSTELFFTLSFLLILPFVQKQWFNLYLFNVNNISFYSFLYYLSGTICPSLICLNSLYNYTYYKFNEKKNYSKKSIKGKSLLCLVAINLIFLSFLSIDYIHINFDLISNLFLEGFNLQQPDVFQLSLYILFVVIFLIFEKSRVLFKKLILGNFILISFYIWYIQINNINIDNQFHIYKYLGFNNLNLINVFILVAIEISYFTWSFLSYKTNLSDWIIPMPQKRDIVPFLNMFIFYSFIIIYYIILT
jgi:hypothetical protein